MTDTLQLNEAAEGGCPPPSCSRLSDVETELRRMAERCRKPAPSGALVLDLAADIVARSGKDAAEVVRLQNAIRSFVTDFERVDWGWDGDCGSKDLVDALFESISANAKGMTRGLAALEPESINQLDG